MSPQIHRLRKKGLRPFTLLRLIYSLSLAGLSFKKQPHILVACMPKSGSTFLSNVIAAHKNVGRRRRLTPAYEDREQELCEISLGSINHLGYVAQHHVRNSLWTQELIARYHLTPIILVRDLADCVVSLRDHVRKESSSTPFLRLTERHLSLSDAELEDVIVQLAMPWYISFYVGWKNDPNALIIHYEDLIADPQKTVALILEQAKVSTTPEQIISALEKTQGKENRFNKGVSGRGAGLQPRTLQRIIDMVALYPELKEERLFSKFYQ